MVTAWDETRKALRQELGALYDIWISPLKFHTITHNGAIPTVHLIAPNDVFRNYVRTGYLAPLVNELRRHMAPSTVVELWLAGENLPSHEPQVLFPSLPALPELASPATPSEQQAARSARVWSQEPQLLKVEATPQPRLFPDPQPPQAHVPEEPPTYPLVETTPADEPESPTALSGPLPPDKTFDRFVVGGCNQFAHAAAMSVAEDPSGGRYNPLFIYGGTGLGKTHLMVAVGHRRLARSPGARVLYVTAEQFTNELIEALRFKRMSEFRDRYRNNVDLLLMDDIQFVTGKERTQEELFHTFEWLRERGRQIIFTADVLPRDIRGFEPRLRTRCESGMLADMQPPDLETLVAILHDKSAASNIELTSDVASYIASRVRGSIREIEGVVHRLGALCRLYRETPSIGFVRAHLGNVLPDGPPVVNADDVVQEVATAFAVPVAQIMGRQRLRQLVQPRHVAMYLVRKHTGASFPEMGRYFKRDHTTIHHAYAKIDGELMTDSELRQIVHIIERALVHGIRS